MIQSLAFGGNATSSHYAVPLTLAKGESLLLHV